MKVQVLFFSGVWALINNAGIASFGDVEFTDIESYRKVLDVNLIGAIQLTKLCLPLIRNARGLHNFVVATICLLSCIDMFYVLYQSLLNLYYLEIFSNLL